MSEILKASPVGVDVFINTLQTKMYSYLTGTAGWLKYESYHRAYKNPKSDGIIPEVYTGKKNYKEVLFDDKFNATSFFLVGDTRTYDGEDGTLSQDVSIIFQANLKKLYPSILHRPDEEMHEDIAQALKKTFKNQYMTGLITGVDNVYDDLDIPASYSKRVKLDDMSQYHVVKIDLNVPYKYCK